jgi:hypothetical protein
MDHRIDRDTRVTQATSRRIWLQFAADAASPQSAASSNFPPTAPSSANSKQGLDLRQSGE